MPARKTIGHPNTARSAKTLWIATSLAMAVTVGLMLPSATLAQDADLPKAELLLDKMVQAIGSKAAREKIKNRVTKGSLSMPAQGMSGTLVVYDAEPTMYRSIVEIADMGTVQRGCDGKCVWEMNPMTGTRILQGKEKEGWLREVRFNGDFYWRERYEKVECQGIEEVKGQPCYKILLTPAQGSPETWFLDQNSHLRVKSLSKLVTAMGELSIEAHMTDFKKVDDLMIPHTLTQSIMGMEQVVKIESIEHNAKIPPEKFELPSEVKALLSEANKPKAESKSEDE